MVFEMQEIVYLPIDIHDMFFDKCIYPITTDCRIIAEGKQVANFRKIHPMLPAMENKLQTRKIIVSIETIIPLRPLRGFQQSLFFIIANGDDLTSGHPGKLSNLDFHTVSSAWHQGRRI